MATIFFTTTANSGTGSLRNALASASAGDVITPDPETFETGTEVTVELSGTLYPSVDVTLDAGNTRLAISYPSGISLYARVADGVTVLNCKGITFVGRVIVAGASSQTLTATFERCTFGGGSSSAYLLQSSSGYTTLTCNDCLFTGALTNAIYVSGSSQTIAFNRCTIAGNASDAVTGNASASVAYVDCLIPSDLSSEYAGFVNAPSDVSGYSTSNLPPWQDWDWAPLAASAYATGATSATGNHDRLGNRRGWNNSGTTAYAVGAFEVVVADYFMKSSANGMFEDPSSWSATRGGTSSVAEITSGVFYIGENQSFLDAPPSGSSVVLEGQTKATLEASGTFNSVIVGRNAELVLGDSQSCANLIVGDGSIISYEASDDAILAVTASATLGTITVTTSGNRAYFATAAGISVTGAIFSGVVACTYGAGVTSFSATASGARSIALSWTQTTSGAPVLIEQSTASGWDALTQDSSGSYTVTLTSGGTYAFRVFDGVSFTEDSAWTGGGTPQHKVTGIVVGGAEEEDNWEVVSEVVDVDGQIRAGQSVTLLARIYDAFDGTTPLLNSGNNIAAVHYTLEKQSKSIYDYEWTAVTGHENVDAGTECVLESLQTSDAWTTDETGYCFVLTPNTTQNTLFATAGTYRFKVTVTLSEGNPVVFYETIQVES